MRPLLAVAIATVAVFLAAWIYLPAPTYFLLAFGVGAPEVSAWIMLGALLALGLAVGDVGHSGLARIAGALGALALVLAATPLARFGATARAFDAAMHGMSTEPAAPARMHPLVIADLFRGIPIGEAKVTRGIVFAEPGGARLALDVYQPRPRGHYPVLVQIYGGAWQRGAPDSDAGFATWLAARGWVVFAIDYRHAPAFRWPAIMSDVDSSLAWIRTHAAEYDGDVARVVLMGRSAGAHLALMAAYRAPPFPIRGVVSYYGPTDLADAYRHPPRPDPLHIRSVEEQFIGGTPDDMAPAYAEASPITLVARGRPPTLLIYGRRDHIVEARYGKQFGERLAAAGSPVAYLEIPWAEHAFDAVFNGPSSQLALYHTERFLAWAVR